MDLKLLVVLALSAAFIAAGVSVACLIRIEDLHNKLRSGGGRGRRASDGLRGWGKVLHIPGGPPRDGR